MRRLRAREHEPILGRAPARAVDGAAVRNSQQRPGTVAATPAAEFRRSAFQVLAPHEAGLLEQSQLCESLSSRTRAEVAARVVRRRIERGQHLVREGDTDESIHMVLSGRLKVVATSLDGDEFIVSFLHPGDCAGTVAAVDGGPSPVSVTAHAPSELLTLLPDDVKALSSRWAEFALGLARMLSASLREANERLGDAHFYDLRTRVARCLADMEEHCAPSAQVEMGTAIPLTQAELAAMLGAGRSRVNKILNDFQHEGVITLSRRSMTIVDLPRLRQSARLEPGAED